MRIRPIRILEVVIVLLAFFIGYLLSGGLTETAQPAQARSVQVPANPHILYLAPPQAQRGLLTAAEAQKRGELLLSSGKQPRTRVK